jgi:hypothetical protein
MKQDKFLIGILIGIAVLVLLALGIFFTRQDNLVYATEDTPAGIVQNYVVAIHKRDYEKAYSYLADVPGRPTLDDFRRSFLNHIVNPDTAGLDIGQTEINGQDATVELGVLYSPGDPFGGNNRNTEYAQLVNQNGIWKLRQLPYNFWSYEWYQPTAQPTK